LKANNTNIAIAKYLIGQTPFREHVVDPTGQGSTDILGMYLFLLRFKLCSCFAVDFILRDFLSSWWIRNITCIVLYCQSIAQGPAALPNITNGQTFLLWLLHS